MSCCFTKYNKRAEKNISRYKKNSIHPIKNKDIPIKEYVEKLNRECIVCHHCKKMCKLRDNEIKIILEGKFITERGRINCSLRENTAEWRWLGIQFVISDL